MAHFRQGLLILALAAALQAAGGGSQRPRFLEDDPIQAMPPPLPVTTVLHRSINYTYDFIKQSRRPHPRPPSPAGAINTSGDVPDNEWFTNRHGVRRMSREELQRGAATDDLPTPPFTITGGKNEGITPGFTMEDSKGRRYFVKLDPVRNLELSTGADVIASKFFYAIGYNTPKNEIVDVKLSDLRVSETARMTQRHSRPRRMTENDVEELVKLHLTNGSFRIVASLAIEGENIGPFSYEGIRADDPNDIVLHEDRRDLRGLSVFGAWLNNTDMRAGNTLDTIVEENGVRFIRHFLLDFGSSLGSNGDRVKSVRSGHKFVLPTPVEAVTSIFTLGVQVEPWERAHFPDLPAVGSFESQLFDPDAWKSNFPNPAFLSRLADDEYWAAKQVMAFRDDDIRAIVETARFSDPRAVEYITATLEQRRDKIGRVFFSKVLSLDHFRVENMELLFDDLAVKSGFQTARTYEIRWSRFDNIAQIHDLIERNGSTRLPNEALKSASGSYFSAVFHATGDETKRVAVYLRKEGQGYKVVGIDRTW